MYSHSSRHGSSAAHTAGLFSSRGQLGFIRGYLLIALAAAAYVYFGLHYAPASSSSWHPAPAPDNTAFHRQLGDADGTAGYLVDDEPPLNGPLEFRNPRNVTGVLLDFYPTVAFEPGVLNCMRFESMEVTAYNPRWMRTGFPITAITCPNTKLKCAWAYSQVNGSRERALDFLRSNEDGHERIFETALVQPDTLNLKCGNEAQMHELIATIRARGGPVGFFGHEPFWRMGDHRAEVGQADMRLLMPHFDYTAHWGWGADVQLYMFLRLPAHDGGQAWFRDGLAVQQVPRPEEVRDLRIAMLSTVTSNCASVERNAIIDALEAADLMIAHYGKCRHNSDYVPREDVIADMLKHSIFSGGTPEKPLYCDAAQEKIANTGKGEPNRLYCRRQKFWDGLYHRMAEKIDLISRHPFTLVIENTASEPGYVTEKLSEALISGSVPIYVGDWERAKIYAPENSVVVLKDAHQVAEYLKAITNDEYDQLIKWRVNIAQSGDTTLVNQWLSLPSPYDVPCSICEYVVSQESFLRERRRERSLSWTNTTGFVWNKLEEKRSLC